MSIRIRCEEDPSAGAQIEFDTITDFYRYDKELRPRKVNHIINGFILQTKTQMKYMDEYGSGTMEWYVVDGKYPNYFEPLLFHPLEDYLQ